MTNLLHKMAERITRFWVIEDMNNKPSRHYPDFPVSPFGPIRLISKETIHDLVKSE